MSPTMPDLRALLEAATPGPWEVSAPEWDRGVEYRHVYGPRELEILYQLSADAALIALAPDLARLVLEAEEAMREIAGYADDDAPPDQCYLPMIGVARAFLARSREVTGGGA
jgi:hypothetical protein